MNSELYNTYGRLIIVNSEFWQAPRILCVCRWFVYMLSLAWQVTDTVFRTSIGRLMRNLSELAGDLAIYGLLIGVIAHNQFVHLYGQRGARLDRDQSVHGLIVNPRTLLVTVISPFLFWTPDAHLQSLEKIWVDCLVHHGPWTEFINGLNTEWHGITIIVLFLHVTVFVPTGLSLL